MVLRVVRPEDVQAQQQPVDSAESASDLTMTQLAGHIRKRWEAFKRHRSSAAGWNNRMLAAVRMFNGEYESQKLREIRKFGGSDVYARIVAVKCRGATGLLRDLYLGAEKPWGVDPTPEPTLPEDIGKAIQELVFTELQTMAAAGQQVDQAAIRDRMASLMKAARQATKKKAAEQAQVAEKKLDDLLVEGRFYEALAEFLVDLPLFPFACLKGPVVRIVNDVQWQNGQLAVAERPKLFWERVSPFDLWFTPGVSDIEDAEVIERKHYSRMDLNELLGVPGYNEDAIRAVLEEYGRGGLVDWISETDSEQADHESRENPQWNESNLITCLEFHGPVQGVLLLEYGFSPEEIDDPLRDYHVQAWLVGRYIIKAQITPSPRKRHPYYITSFEKRPGTVVGNGLPDILSDIQDVCNATLRSLVNNLAIASGPQVVVDIDRLDKIEDADTLYPWKRWHVSSDPMSNNSQQPVTFFQPGSNAGELLGVYEKFNQIADDLSAIPRYFTGSERLGGAGRTASGLAMLMGNANKVLQTVAANIDRDVFSPLLQALYDMVMLTDQSGILRGDENVHVRGVMIAIQKETQRQRALEFLQITANPIDMQITGLSGRAEALRTVAEQIGMDGSKLVPDTEEIEARQAAMMQAQAQSQPGQPPSASGNQAPAPAALDGPRSNLMQQTPQP